MGERLINNVANPFLKFVLVLDQFGEDGGEVLREVFPPRKSVHGLRHYFCTLIISSAVGGKKTSEEMLTLVIEDRRLKKSVVKNTNYAQNFACEEAS